MVSLIFDALKLFFFLNLILDFKIDFLWIFILKSFSNRCKCIYTIQFNEC